MVNSLPAEMIKISRGKIDSGIFCSRVTLKMERMRPLIGIVSTILKVFKNWIIDNVASDSLMMKERSTSISS